MLLSINTSIYPYPSHGKYVNSGIMVLPQGELTEAGCKKEHLLNESFNKDNYIRCNILVNKGNHRVVLDRNL